MENTENNKTFNISEDVLKNTVSEVVKNQISEFETKIKDEMQREIKSNLTPQVLTPKIEIKSEGIDKQIYGKIMRGLAYAKQNGMNPKDGVIDFAKGLDDSYTQTAITKTINISTPEAGGLLIPTAYANEIISPLFAKAVVRSTGASYYAMPQGQITVRKTESGSQAYYVGESTGATSSTNPAYATVTLTAKKMIAKTVITNEAAKYSSGLADQTAQNDLAKVLTNLEDQTFLTGSGTSNTPKGLYGWINAANVKTMTATPTFTKAKKDLIGVVAAVEANNVYMTSPYWIMHPTIASSLYSSEAPNNTYSPIFQSLIGGDRMLFGYKVLVTTNCPKSKIFFGDFSEAMIGDVEGLVLAVSTEDAFSTDETVIRATLKHDFAVKHDLAFSVLEGITWDTTLS